MKQNSLLNCEFFTFKRKLFQLFTNVTVSVIIVNAKNVAAEAFVTQVKNDQVHHTRIVKFATALGCQTTSDRVVNVLYESTSASCSRAGGKL